MALFVAALGLCVLVASTAFANAGDSGKRSVKHRHHHKPKPGPRGRRGATGARGPAGPAGSGSLALTYTSFTSSPANGEGVDPRSFEFAKAFCPVEGQIATGGGVTSDGTVDDPVYVVESVSQAGGGWFGAVENRGDQPHSFTIWAVCTPATVGQAKAPAAKTGGKTGPRGRRGRRGATGPAGPAGAAGTSQVSLTYVSKQAPGTSGNTTGTATCPAGQHVTGGGVGSEATLGKQWLTDSGPTADGTGWAVSMDNFGAQPQFTVHAICTASTVTAGPAAKSPGGGHAKRGPRGPRGRRGATGPQGPQGTSPPVATIPLTEVAATDIPAPAQAQTAGSVDCPAGQHVTGGGFIHFSDAANQMSTNSAFPQDSDTWLVAVDNTSNAAASFEVDAVCTPSSVVAAKR